MMRIQTVMLVELLMAYAKIQTGAQMQFCFADFDSKTSTCQGNLLGTVNSAEDCCHPIPWGLGGGGYVAAGSEGCTSCTRFIGITEATVNTDTAPTTLSTDVTQTTVNTDTAPTTLSTDVTQTTINTDIAPTTLSTDVTQTTVNTDNAPTTLSTDVTQTTVNTDIAPTTLSTDVTQTTVNIDIALTTLSTGATVGIAVGVTVTIILLVGALVGVLLYHCISKHRSQHEPESASYKQQLTDPQYKGVQANPENEVPVTSGEEFDLRENVAYDPVQRF